MTKKSLWLAVLTITVAVIGIASVPLMSHMIGQDMQTPTPSAYVSLLDTDIRGMSPEEIEGYQTGAGMGFALPAELNGHPGPRHLLDLSDELELDAQQLTEIERLYNEMLAEAIALGEQILVVEGDLEAAFREGEITEADLQTQLAVSEQLRSDLRYVHLRTHLATVDLLTPHQIQQYNVLRGYNGTVDHREHGGH